MSVHSNSGSESKWAPLHAALKKWWPLGWDFIVKYGPGIAVIIFGLWTAITWVWQRSDQYSLEKMRAEQASQVALRESQKPFLEKQLVFYFEAAKVTGTLATRAPNEPEWSSARMRFWELYWGELGVVESPEVGSAMVAFGQNLRSIEKCVDDRKGCDGMQEPLTGKALGLAHSIRGSIQNGWGYQLPELSSKKVN